MSRAHLKTRVHFTKVKVALRVDEKLHRAGRDVVHSTGEGARLLSHCLSRRGIQERAGRLLNDLLVAALDGALALVQIHNVAVDVSKNLQSTATSAAWRIWCLFL